MNPSLHPVLDFEAWGTAAGNRLRRRPYPFDPGVRAEDGVLSRDWQIIRQREIAHIERGLSWVEGQAITLAFQKTRDAQDRVTDIEFFLQAQDGALFLPDTTFMAPLSRPNFVRSISPDGAFALCDFHDYPLVACIEHPILFLGSHPNFGHWIADYLGKLLLAELDDDAQARPVIVGLTQGFHAALLERMGWRSDRLLDLAARPEERGRILFSDLMVPAALPYSIAYRYLRDRTGSGDRTTALPNKERRLYLSRRNLTPRHRVANQDQIESNLVRIGFEIVEMEAMPLATAQTLLSEARLVVAPVGAALGNFIFSHTDAELIHLVPSYLVAPSETEDLFIFFKRYYYPLLDRLQFVLGDTSDDASPLPFLDRPWVYDWRSLDLAILNAEKRLIQRQLGRRP